MPFLAWTEVDWKQCRNRVLHCLKFGSGSWNVTWSESDTRNSLLSGSDTLCAMCHFLTCQFWHMPVLACQVLTPTGFYTVFKQFMPVLAHEPVLTLFPNWIPNCVLFEFMLGGWHVQMPRGISPPPTDDHPLVNYFPLHTSTQRRSLIWQLRILFVYTKEYLRPFGDN